ncbi:hypothetical protein RHOFW510R12_32390 [Rhodanobacter sp. FW510-R12]|uniref:DUF3108 domain-containing protein n=1 Tax=unclassified Rhodanobacter TaxID=2621553 RepID=UPI0007AA4733|nr:MULTISPECIES: DUF3108 domain-containing protein [unclassified Rhodanobacter]KZC16196.1 hypothetical protein RHOFW104R8_00955 [Rhodanobacter sp. FW104-R8]KZC26164.1 hypothetical protein RhoFW510T8_03680 [Rhodanobacter sp. FW510-T8]KZC30025.1 hypothetical protein RhoFW510R10_03740 [Rhodanobacter sp. FW510-R10]
MTIRPLLAPLLGLGLLLGARAIPAATPTAFTATYDVSQGGQPMGVATVTLRAAGNGEWIYSKDVKGTGGLAALLGANVTESSRFRWKGDVPEAIGYDYQLQAAVKQKQRHLAVDWPKNRVTVDEGKGPQSYPARPGMVERNTLALALGLALRDGRRQITLPVAVRQEVQAQHFEVTGKETVKVPAGSFAAQRVDRTDADRGFSAWYAPGRYPLPVKLSQHDGGDMVMELVRYRAD